MRSELRSAIRRLINEPALAIAAIATLALGIGACTAMFSIVEAVLLKSMDVARPQRLLVMWPQTGDTAGEFTYDEYRELSRPSAFFEGVALTGSTNWPIPTDIVLPGGRRTRATQSAVSDTFFEVLGARPLLGRTFHSGEDHPGAPAEIVVSAAFWKTRLGGDPAIVGRTLAIGRDAVRIVGVMPPEFFYPAGADFWTPVATLLSWTAPDKSPASIEQIFTSVGAFHLVARLKPGVSLRQAEADASARWRLFARRSDNASARVSVTTFGDHVFGKARRALWILMGAVCLVLLLACANVAGLLVARNALRAREVAIRRALGASAWALLRENFLEASVLAVTGGVLGIAVAASSLRALIALSPATVVRLSDARVDSGVLAVCVLITAAVTFAVGVIPALQSQRSDIASMQALGVRDVGRGIRSGTRRVLVAGEVAITVILLVAGALTGRTFLNLAELDLGFDPSNVLTLDLAQLDQSRYRTYAARHRAVEDLVRDLASRPGVESAAAVLNRPFAHGVIGWDSALLLEGQPDVDAAWLRNPTVNFEVVTPGYFDTMRVRLREGRDFASTDRSGTPRVAIVSQNLAARMWPGQNPIGRRLADSFGRARDGRPAQWLTVVGVVSAVHYRELERPRFDLYVPLAQVDDFDPQDVVVRTAENPRALISAVAAMLSTIDPELTAADVTTMDEVVRRVRAPWRFDMLLFSAFGVMSIALTIIGIGGLVVSTVNSRRREIGVRLALGAQTHEVVRLIAFQGAWVIAFGIALGAASSLVAARALSSLLYGVTAGDPVTLLLVAAGVFTCGALASYLPARRAARIDPSISLRES